MRTITAERAREIAREWYSPQDPALVALATLRTHVPDHLMPYLVTEIESTLTYARAHDYPKRDIKKLEQLLRWAQAEARTRGLE